MNAVLQAVRTISVPPGTAEIIISMIIIIIIIIIIVIIMTSILIINMYYD